MSFKTSFALGLAGSEMPLPMKVLAISREHKNVEAQNVTAAGDLRRSIIKVEVPLITMQAAAVPQATMARLRGFRHSQALLNFLAEDSISITDQICTASGASTVVLPNMSASGVTIAGVYLATDVNRTGTNYFSGGSYDAPSRTITLGTPLPAENSQVVVDYAFTGHTVLLTRLLETPHQGQFVNLWQAMLELTGA